ncbi:hypothetical protein RQP46_004841 [Phenoliferia psychrophenolica]
MRFAPSFLIAAIAAFGSVSALGSTSHAADLAQTIRSRQARIVPRSPMFLLEKRATDVYNSLQQMQTDLLPHTTAITSLCSQLSSATTSQQRSSIGAQIAAAAGVFSGCVTTLHSCATQVSSVLSKIPQLSESISSNFNTLDSEMTSLLEGGESSLSGLTSYVASFTSSLRKTSTSSSSSSCSLSTLYSKLNSV